MTPAQLRGLEAVRTADDPDYGPALTWAGANDPELALVNGRTATVLEDLRLVRCIGQAHNRRLRLTRRGRAVLAVLAAGG